MSFAAQLLNHAEACRFDRLPHATVQAALTFITDSVAVGLSGSRHPRIGQVREAAAAWGQGDAACEWVSGTRWPSPTAALLNAWQIHNQEFDCVHEGAVVHPMATILPALVVQAEVLSASGRPVSGKALIEAVVLAVDVAATLGVAHQAPMRFFRPAMCGALGATLGLAHLSGCSQEQTADAFGIAYSQLAGTMQAHVEGSPMLALQVGMAARAAVTSLQLAQAGFGGPRGVIDGPFGYFDLYDAPLAPRRDQVQSVFDQLGQRHRIEELSHKPFPTGRAAQGAIDGLATLVAQHGLHPEQVRALQLAAPPLIQRLIGRPLVPQMDVNYARLCLPYLVGSWLVDGHLDLDAFSPQALNDPDRLARAAGVSVVPNDCIDPNALAPQTVQLTLGDKRVLTIDLPAVLGHPDRPLPAAAQRRKFDHCCARAGLTPEGITRLHAACMDLAGAADLRPWLQAMAAPLQPSPPSPPSPS